MSIIIIGGNERMEKLYEKTCLDHGCKNAKVFTKMNGEMKKRLGFADLYILLQIRYRIRWFIAHWTKQKSVMRAWSAATAAVCARCGRY
ncbi:hypothetical protein SDC9_181812 [bioreactor metagenome]|uniref:Uncharacterized protein n=1 Tax=bioreactor metagenome TaxID=1076179 RepID=A0A645H8A1_9ZZZZ